MIRRINGVTVAIKLVRAWRVAVWRCDGDDYRGLRGRGSARRMLVRIRSPQPATRDPLTDRRHRFIVLAMMVAPCLRAVWVRNSGGLHEHSCNPSLFACANDPSSRPASPAVRGRDLRRRQQLQPGARLRRDLVPRGPQPARYPPLPRVPLRQAPLLHVAAARRAQSCVPQPAEVLRRVAPQPPHRPGAGAPRAAHGPVREALPRGEGDGREPGRGHGGGRVRGSVRRGHARGGRHGLRPRRPCRAGARQAQWSGAIFPRKSTPTSWRSSATSGASWTKNSCAPARSAVIGERIRPPLLGDAARGC